MREIRIVQVLYGVTAAEPKARPVFPDPLGQLEMVDLVDFDDDVNEGSLL